MEKQPGKKHKDELKEKAFALLVCNNASYVAKELGLPYTTVKTWENKFIKEGKKQIDETQEGTTEKTSSVDEHNLVMLRHKKKEEFINSAWDIIDLGKQILHRRFRRALESEDKLDDLEKELMSLPNTDLSTEQKKALAKKLSIIKVEDVGKLTTALGTLYDKQALANGEATSREEQILKGFEDY